MFFLCCYLFSSGGKPNNSVMCGTMIVFCCKQSLHSLSSVISRRWREHAGEAWEHPLFGSGTTQERFGYGAGVVKVSYLYGFSLFLFLRILFYCSGSFVLLFLLSATVSVANEINVLLSVTGRMGGMMLKTKNSQRHEVAIESFCWLDYQDSNLDKQNQNLLCYHYTIVQTLRFLLKSGAKIRDAPHICKCFKTYFQEWSRLRRVRKQMELYFR